MKGTKKDKLKKVAHILVKSAKKSGEFIKKYGPKVQHHARAISESTMDAMIPRRTRTVVDLTVKRKPKRVAKGRRGFYLDYTQ